MKFLLSPLFLAVSDVKSYQQKYVGKVKKKYIFLRIGAISHQSLVCPSVNRSFFERGFI